MEHRVDRAREFGIVFLINAKSLDTGNNMGAISAITRPVIFPPPNETPIR
jgi:hypothetical protein